MPHSRTSLVAQCLTEALCSHCRRHGFSLWLEKFRPPCSLAEQKGKKKQHTPITVGTPSHTGTLPAPCFPRVTRVLSSVLSIPPDNQELLFKVGQNKDTSKFCMFLKCIYVLSAVFLCYLPFLPFLFFFLRFIHVDA